MDLGKFLLVQCHGLASLVEDEEARAGGALVDATDKYFLCRSHCGCSALAGVSVLDRVDGSRDRNWESKFLCTCLCSSSSSEAARFKATWKDSCLEAIERRDMLDEQRPGGDAAACM